MKKVKIKVSVTALFTGSTAEDVLIVEVKKDASASEIKDAKEQAAKEWLSKQVDFSWRDEK